MAGGDMTRSLALAIVAAACVASLVTLPSAASTSVQKALAVSLGATAASFNWLQYGGNPQHNANNTQETTIGLSNVATLRQVYRVPLPSSGDSSPLFLSGVNTPTGVRDLVYVSITDGHLVALDALSGEQIWVAYHPYPGTCTFATGETCFSPSTPAIDPNLQYIYSYGLDGFAHKHQVTDGTEIRSGGWPEMVTAKPTQEKESASLSIATASNGASYLYVGTSSDGDLGDYQGHLTSINLADGTQHVFNMLCSDQVDLHFVRSPGTPDCSKVGASLWGRNGVLYVPGLDRIALATANADFIPASHDWGDSVLELNPNGTGTGGAPLDSYTPSNQLQLNQVDQDLGSVGPALLPVPATSLVQRLALQTGKDANVRLLNLDNLSGQGSVGNLGGEVAPIVALPSGPAGIGDTAVPSAPAVWINPADGSTWSFISNPNGLTGLHLVFDNSGHPSMQIVWHNGCTCVGLGGNSPLVANGVLFIANMNDLQALDPTTGVQLWNDPTIGYIHWSSPIVASGTLYLTTTYLSAYRIVPVSGLTPRVFLPSVRK
jgi:outer membrane protein assembly factor BamB